MRAPWNIHRLLDPDVSYVGYTLVHRTVKALVLAVVVSYCKAWFGCTHSLDPSEALVFRGACYGS